MPAKSQNNKFLFYVLPGLFLLVVLLYLLKRVLVVKNIVFLHQNKSIAIKIEQQPFLNRPLMFSDFDHLPFAQQVLYDEQNQAYQMLGYYKKFPQTLIVLLEKQEPIYQLIYQDKFYLIDQSGNKRQVEQLQALPSIYLNLDLPSDWNLSSTWHQAFLTLVEESQNLAIERIECQKDGQLILDLFSNQIVLIELNEQLKANLARLKVILEQVKAEDLPQPVQKIDLRFKLPVLK